MSFRHYLRRSDYRRFGHEYYEFFPYIKRKKRYHLKIGRVMKFIYAILHVRKTYSLLYKDKPKKGPYRAPLLNCKIN